MDVLPLERFNAVWRPNEPDRLKPVYVERVTIREALKGDLIPSLFGIVQLIEPTFGVRLSLLAPCMARPRLFTCSRRAITLRNPYQRGVQSEREPWVDW